MNNFSPEQQPLQSQQPHFPNAGKPQHTGLSTKTLVSICLAIVLVGVGVVGVYQLIQNSNNNVSPKEIGVESVGTVTEPVPEDLDNDGVLDTKEKELGLSNRNYDTDGDGLTDKQELEMYNTDPTNTDSDGDGYADGYEVMNGFNPAGDGKLPEDTK